MKATLTYAERKAARLARRHNPSPQALAARRRARTRRVAAQTIKTQRLFAADDGRTPAGEVQRG